MSIIKKSFLLFSLIIAFCNLNTEASAQTKVGYIDSKRILDAMQDSKDAKLRLDNLVTEWQTELKVLQDSLKFLKDDYEKKKLILTDQLKTQTELQITGLENSVTNFKVQKFGENGEYFQKQTEYMKPVQDRVFKAIEFVAKDGGFDYVFDRNSDIMLLYVNENYDLTAKVIKQIEGK
ncbi:MAG TPA: OmpH family outer membrane protein [Ignavibacteria bacterium]|nr:OmpH family outer membrane protein [Ignavibacteria bacterium]